MSDYFTIRHETEQMTSADLARLVAELEEQFRAQIIPENLPRTTANVGDRSERDSALCAVLHTPDREGEGK